jgi:hypothetical protein
LEEIDAKIADLGKMRAELTRMLTTCKQRMIEDFRIIETLGPVSA